MKVNPTGPRNEERAIVEVRRDAVLGLWRNGTLAEGEDPSSLRKASTSLRKNLEFAEKDFLLGRTDPVPLTEVRCRVRPESISRSINASSFVGTTTKPYVSVADGVARMLWLTSHGARCFPVECLVAEAPLLSRLAGTRSKWMRVSELLPL
ncbi:plasmid fertility inhibition factor family protein [Paraburkholderia sp. HD33-4]|uniref:plasmid fertility inhibition factor family protein n=1 Tax=Paraburkholderia sp. HD33-4 TaxID=2883242 RepID=UPI003FA352E8